MTEATPRYPTDVGPTNQRGAVLLMSLVFLLLLGVMAAGVGALIGAQSRESAGYQHARQQFQAVNGVLLEASRDRDSLFATLLDSAPPGDAEAGMANPNGGDIDSDKSCRRAGGGVSSSLCLETALLRAGYACQVTGFSSGSCFAIELRGWAAEGDATEATAETSASQQVYGLLIETPNIVSGGDGRAGVFP
ncbi:hypothetical protein [Salinicola aestuarinus]|uniref:hypothetical protein n=1 Tax=Salinicola aestuarinus TaxID=1949082 RepID=UPI000DA23154|nr:hypothetical protein [Salinicola aestuarinus]